ncbi:class I SAM-dependent methyltransferase, partial [bacterium]|nr:class I SAM-dependent methyltransferase [bacterium]
MDGGYSYAAADLKTKIDLVGEMLDASGSGRVLDIGCNTGYFSLLAAKKGFEVVATDSDAAVVGEVWREATRQNANVLPLVVNLARPTPAIGWCNREGHSFLARAEKKFDGLLMLAVLHHLVITEGIPLREVLALAARLTKDWVVLEYIAPEDRAFRNLCRGRDFSFLTQEYFESQLAPFFQIARKQTIAGTHRTLYYLRGCRDGQVSTG